jgi:anti-sigma B factor antagonist
MANTASYRLINVRFADDVAVVTFRGTNAMFDGAKVENVARELFDLLEAGTTNKILLDLSTIYFMSSTMLAELVRMHRRVHAKRGRLILCAPRPAIEEAFRISKFDKFFEIHANASTALKKF